MIIKDNITKINFKKGRLSQIKYIVIHYTANNGDTAYGNTQYFKSVQRGASAHYFVDENSIWRCVKEADTAWHCGGSLMWGNGGSCYKKCTNANSIGIEMCSRKNGNGDYYFLDKTVANTAELVRYLMKKHNIPASNVIRHYDVTSKICPAPFVNDETKWIEFKGGLGVSVTPQKDNTIEPGDTVKVKKNVIYGSDLPFKVWYDTYTVLSVSGDRVVIGVNGVTSTAIHINNIEKVNQ